jgi:hypothetical protein
MPACSVAYASIAAASSTGAVSPASVGRGAEPRAAGRTEGFATAFREDLTGTFLLRDATGRVDGMEILTGHDDQ